MILIIGGYGAGKREYVIDELGYSEAEIADAELNEFPVLINLDEYMRTYEINIGDERYEALLSKEVITCAEIGNGIVPLDKSERDYRENVGRLCIELAKNAEKVIRIYCGIPTVLKGENKEKND